MHIRRGAYLRVAEGLRFKSYSRLSKILSIIVICLLIILSAVLAFQNTSATPPCPCNIFSPSVPAVEPGIYNQAGGIELGVKFKVDRPGYISGARFYKVTGMSGVHTASIWNSVGQRLATATFSSESTAGWQEINFTPIAITAGSVYTVSVFMADGNYVATPAYFNSPITNEPFNIPQHGQAWDGLGGGGQGVYNASGSSAYPDGSFNATNYWVDTVYISSPNSAAPAVTVKYPSADATDIAVSDALTATFDKRLNSATVSTDTFIVKNAQGDVISGIVSYDPSTSLIKFIASQLLQTNTTYTVTLRGGSGTVLSDYDGHSFGADYQWSFTTSSTPLTCPCSLKNKQAPKEATTYREQYPNGLEVGLKIVPATKGYITSIRFYKPLISSQQSSHVGHIWDSNGNSLATVMFSDESEYGWQEATLASPLSVSKDTVYIISYGITNSIYMTTINSFVNPIVSPGFAAYPSGDSRNQAFGSGTGNSVYALTAGAYPSNPTGSNQDYIIDAVFSLNPNQVEPLNVTQIQPSADSYGIKASTSVSATFNQALDPLTVDTTTMYVRGPGDAIVSGQVSYDAAEHAMTFDPATNFEAGKKYTATVTTSVKDVRGEHLPAIYTWSFTVGSSPVIDMNQGKGGPILIVTSGNDNYSKYYAEILRTEGINYFDVQDIATLTPIQLHTYKAVLLSQLSLTQTQADMFQDWVISGGNLVAMRPDKKLASFFGLKDAGGVTANAYMKVNIATRPGLGIMAETMQYKGVADKYTTDTATVVAQLYSDQTTATLNPAVTTRSVGAGTAMSFSYDLARSVVGLHQGNQAWAGWDRNLDGTTRTNDLFYGATPSDMQPNWLNDSKMDIPQADEQQRLLINLLTDAMKSSIPAPRFWYLPNNQKAALVLTGDDHGLANADGTETQLNHLLNVSDSTCSVMDWECTRATHYIYTTSEITNARAAQFANYGFEIGAHPESTDVSCSMASSYSQVTTHYANYLASWRAKYNTLPHQQTSRFHCYAWPSWDWMPRADYANGVRYDLNTVAYPASWVGARSPMVTGSGMNMRLTDASGNLLDVRQGVTNFDNISAGPASIAAMLDNALGANGYYGIFGSHYDMTDTYAATLYAAASSRHIPMITAEQALTWLDGKAGSNFSNLTSSETGKVTFKIDVAEGAYGLQAMMPMQNAHGTLSTIKFAGQSVVYRTDIVKGVQYAIFNAQPGQYEVIYSDFGSVTSGEKGSVLPQSSRAHLTALPVNSDQTDSPTPTSVSQRSSNAYRIPNQRVIPVEPSSVWWQTPTILWTAGSAIVVLGGGAGWILAIRRR